MHRATTRREALQAGIGILAAAAGGRALAAQAKDETVPDVEVPIVDTHQHLWDLDTFELPWLTADSPLNRDYVMSDYLQATEGLGVVKAVYMEVNVAPAQQAKEAEYVIDLCRRGDNPTVAAVIGGSPQTKGFRAYAERFANEPEVKGIRTVLHDPDRPKGMCLEPQFVENMKLLGELGLSFDFCMRPAEVGDAVKLAGKCPKTRFIIDHCGNMPVQSDDEPLRRRWSDAMQAAAGLENVVCKISGIVVTARDDNWTPRDLAPVVDVCLDTFGEDRVFFGGDWPVCTLRSSYRQWVEALREIVKGRPAEFRRKLFHDNAVRFYGLA